MSEVAIHDVTVFTGDGPVLEGASVVVRDGRIADVADHGGPISVGPDAVHVDGARGFLMPGLIDAHTHLTLHRGPEVPEPQPQTPFLSAWAAGRKLISGVTTARDVGGHGHVNIALARATAARLVPGPRIVAAGQAISATGGHIHYFCRQADGPIEITKAVREQIRAGAGVIKIMVTGGSANDDEDPERLQLQPDEIAAAVREATEAKLPVAAHAVTDRAARLCAQIGTASVEHGGELTEQTLELLKSTGTVLVPTVAVYRRMVADIDGWGQQRAADVAEFTQQKEPSLRQAIALGVTIGVGTDCGRHFPHDAIADEMITLHELGMSTEAVLLAATRTNAALLGWQHEIGTVQIGKRADLVLFGGNPLDDLTALRAVQRVFVDGQQRFRPTADN